MKRSFLVILAIIALIIITGCSFEKEEEKTIVDKFKSEYESLNGKVIDDKVELYMSVEDTGYGIKKEDYEIFFSQKTLNI